MKRLKRHIRQFFRDLRHIFINGWLLRGYQRKIPQTIIIEPTNVCNLHCSCCPHGNENEKERLAGFMSRQTFDKILGHIDIPVKYVCLYLHGEPFLNKELDYFVGQLDQKQILTTVYSNGYNTDLGLLEKVLKYPRTQFSFSIDVFSKENYEQIRQPAKYKTMMEQLAIIDKVFEKYQREFEITMVIEGESFEHTDEICKKLFADYCSLKKISFGSKFPWPEHFYTGELNDRLSKKRNLCAQIEGNASVYWNGKVTMCSYDFSGKLVIGDLTKNRLSEVYNSSVARKIRKYHYLHRYSKVSVCQKCILPRYKSSSWTVTRKQALGEKQITGKL